MVSFAHREDKIIGFDAHTSGKQRQLEAEAPLAGHGPGQADAVIAAIAASA